MPSKEYYQKHKEEVKAQSAAYKRRHPHKDEQLRDARKLRVLTYYSKSKGVKCCWKNCTVSDPDMLSLDHVENNGARDRKEKPTGDNFYRYIESAGYPKGFQTLCHNHQWKKEILRRRKVRAQKFRSTELNTK